ncbi:MAG: NGG1p interacting factor NIF3 [Bacillota bacterium]|nr:NGG1p interacting factor NIF3 [Bacillota bacterium]
MKLQELYALAIEMGMEADPRGRAAAEKCLLKAKKAFDKLDEEEQPFFDRDQLINPYGDTRILNGEPDAEIRKLIAGVDMELSELLLADRLNEKGAGIDLVLAHHPEGRALLNLPRVMGLQPLAFAGAGVQLNVAESLLEGRCREVETSVGVSNYNRAVDAARLLGLNMMCVHTPCDNLVNTFLTKLMEAEAPETVGDVCKLLRSIPEYELAAKTNNPAMIVSGCAERSAGKVFVDMTGGTGGPKEYYRLLSEAGVGTVLCMHAGKDTIEVSKEAHISVVIAGHMPSDSLGINLFLDQVEAAGVETLCCSGLTRFKRS